MLASYGHRDPGLHIREARPSFAVLGQEETLETSPSSDTDTVRTFNINMLYCRILITETIKHGPNYSDTDTVRTAANYWLNATKVFKMLH